MSSGRDEMLSRGHIDYEKAKTQRNWWLNKTGGAAQDNLTVRDSFAISALNTAVMAWKWNSTDMYGEGGDYVWEDEYWEYVSEIAYKIADAMLKERENDPQIDSDV